MWVVAGEGERAVAILIIRHAPKASLMADALSEQGEAEAEALARSLERRFKRGVVSGTSRAIQTLLAFIDAEGIRLGDCKIDDRVEEARVPPPTWQDRLKVSLSSTQTPVHAAFHAHREIMLAAGRQLINALEELAASGENEEVLVVSHAFTMGAAWYLLTGELRAFKELTGFEYPSLVLFPQQKR